MRRFCLRAALFAALAVAAPLATAQSSFSVSGFATLGAVAIDRDDLWFYRPSVNRPGNDNPDLGPDTLAAVQGSLHLTERTDLTLQLMSAEDPKGSYTPRVTWAFLRHIAAPGLEIRVGRLRVPFMMLSDSLYVNYANLWIRPPVEVYGLNPFNDLDGADLLYQARLGDVDVEVHPYFGNGRVSFPSGSAELRDTWGINLTLSRGDLLIHLGHGEARLSLRRGDPSYLRLVAALDSLGVGKIANDLSGDDGHARFDAVGLQWDDGAWQLIGEFARRSADRYVTSARGWYVTAGRRFGTVTPFVTLARQRQDRAVSTASVPAPLQDGFAAFLASRNTAQRSIGAGVRWDFRRNAAFKTEFTHAYVDADSWGSFFPRDAASNPSFGTRRVNMLGMSVDVAF